MKREEIISKVQMETKLRCYKCNFEFLKRLDIKDNISDINCPGCGKTTCELNLGR